MIVWWSAENRLSLYGEGDKSQPRQIGGQQFAIWRKLARTHRNRHQGWERNQKTIQIDTDDDDDSDFEGIGKVRLRDGRSTSGIAHAMRLAGRVTPKSQTKAERLRPTSLRMSIGEPCHGLHDYDGWKQVRGGS
jgi:hypothetical protein